VLAVATTVLATVAAGTAAVGQLPVLVGSAVFRAGMLLAGIACVGLTLVGLLLPASRTADDVRRPADRATVAAAGGWIVLVVLGVAFRAADTFGIALTQLRGTQLLRWTTELSAGRGMLLTAGCAAAVLGCALARLRESAWVSLRIPLVAALLGVVTPAVTGHAGSAPNHQLAVISIALHGASAALWCGGLAALVTLVAHRGILLRDTIGAFSTLAGGCLAVVTITGLLNAWLRLESWSALFTTGYGALVIAKTACLVLLALLGGIARQRLAAGRTPVLRWAGWEVAVMAVTLGLAATLSQTA
jgi:copper resistance protein D